MVSKEWCLFETIRLSHAKRFVCCVLTIRYNIYSLVGRSIASISNLGGIFTSALHAFLSKYGASGQVYWQWTSLPYNICYICTLGSTFWQSTDSTMCYVQRVHVSHKATQALCALKTRAHKCHIPSKECIVTIPHQMHLVTQTAMRQGISLLALLKEKAQWRRGVLEASMLH